MRVINNRRIAKMATTCLEIVVAHNYEQIVAGLILNKLFTSKTLVFIILAFL